MIVRQFLQFLRKSPATERADAAAALARAYLYSKLSPNDRAAAEGALLILLDDPSPLVRKALAQALAASEQAPVAVIFGLAADQPDIACCVLEHSPLLLDSDLVDAVATGTPKVQIAIAGRTQLPCAVAAAIAEVGSAEACLVLIESRYANIAASSLDRIAARFGHLGAIREALLNRADLPTASRHKLLVTLSQTLVSFVERRRWLDAARAQRIATEACEKATFTLALSSPPKEVAPLVQHLRETGQLNAGLILRALLSGNFDLFEQALAELAELPLKRVRALVEQGGSGFRALFDKAGLPASTFIAFREAIAALGEEASNNRESRGQTRLRRRVVERVLARCRDHAADEIEPLLILLRRFAGEAARDEARTLCEVLMSCDVQLPAHEMERAA